MLSIQHLLLILGGAIGRIGDFMVIRHVLLVEPFPDLRDVLRDIMHDAQWIVDAAMTTYEMRLALAQTNYDCVFINLDQGRLKNFGLDLADYATERGARVIMIPDNDLDPATIAPRGWLQLNKPFSVAQFQDVLVQALGPAGTLPAIQQRASDTKADGLDTLPLPGAGL
jgi:DNA-binding NtrC family response regulator